MICVLDREGGGGGRVNKLIKRNFLYDMRFVRYGL